MSGKIILLIIEKKQKLFFYSQTWTTMGKQPHVKQKHPRVPTDLRKRTRQRAKCVFAVSWGALQSFRLQLFSLDFARFSTGCCEAGAEFGAGSGGSRSEVGPGSEVSSTA